MFPRCSILIVWLAVLLRPLPVLAQGTWAVTVAAAGETGDAGPRAAGVAAVRLRGNGAEVLPLDEARRRLEAAAGEAPASLPPGLATALGSAADTALEHVAFGRNEETLAVGNPEIRRAADHLPAVGRDDATRTALSNLCLFTVRALQQLDRDDEARTRTFECVRLIPDLEPDTSLHPRGVRQMVRDVRDRIARGRASLVVAAPADLEGCSVRVQGRPVGETPIAGAQLAPGRHAVQVSCDDAPGRVHRVTVEEGRPRRIEIDPRFGARVSVDEAVTLRYEDAATRERLLGRDVRRLGSALEVPDVLVVNVERSSDASSILRLDRFRAGDGGGVVASSRIPWPTPPERVGRAVGGLIEGRSLDLTGEQPSPMSPHTPAGVRVVEDGRAGDQPSGSNLAAWVLAAVGTAGLAGTWVLQGTWFSKQAQLDRLDPSREDTPLGMEQLMAAEQEVIEERDERGVLVLISGGISAGVLTAAVPLLMPEVEGIPWWSWIAGALGAGVVTAGVLLTAEDRQSLDDLNRLERTVPLGPLIAMHGAPLLAVPLTYVVRSLTGADGDDGTAASLAPVPGGAALGFRETF